MLPFLTSFLNPIFYIFLFGLSMARIFPNYNNYSYLTFIIPGVLSLVSVENSIQASFSFFIDRITGVYEEILSSPVTKADYLVAKVLTSLTIVIIQTSALIIFITPVVNTTLTFINLSIIFFAVILGVISLTCIGLSIALKTESTDKFNAVWSIIYLPIIFTSPIFYPIEAIHPLLKIIGKLNPLTYIVNVIRSGFLGKEVLIQDLAGLILFTFFSIFIALILFQRSKLD